MLTKSTQRKTQQRMGKKAAKPKFKRAPGAPKRFKSAFMFYSEQQHKLIRNATPNKKIRAADVAKTVSQSWKQLSEGDRAYWVDIANRDRERFEWEKAAYNGPWKVPDVKDPDAPKKPMSAFLAFGNERRKAIAEQNPSLSNTDISHLLAKLWRESSEDVKQHYRDREAKERKEFKKVRSEWERQKEQRGSESNPNSMQRAAHTHHQQPLTGQQRCTFPQYPMIGEPQALPSMESTLPISPNRPPAMHPFAAFPPSKVNNSAVQPLLAEQAGIIGWPQQACLKVPPASSSNFDTTALLTETGQYPFPMYNAHMSLPGIAALDALQLGPTTYAAPATVGELFMMEDAANKLSEEPNYAPIQNSATAMSQLYSPTPSGNLPMAYPSLLDAAPSVAQERVSTTCQMPPIEQMSPGSDNNNQMRQSNDADVSSLFDEQEKERLQNLAKELGDDAVKKFIGAFR